MKRTLTLSMAAAAVLGLAACSSSHIAATSSGTSGAAPVSGAKAVVAAAQAELNKYAVIPRFTAPNAPFGVSSLKGKRIAIIVVDETTPSLVNTVKAAQQAASLVGITATLYNAQDSPSQMTAGVAQAIATHANAILLVGVSAKLTAAQLADAKKAGIPVVMANNSEPDASAPGQGSGPNIYATAAPDYVLQGRLAADAAVAETGGDAKAILVTTDGIDPGPSVFKGLQEGMAACSTCRVLAIRHVQLQDWFNGTLASDTASVLSSHHSANIVLPIYVTMTISMMPTARQADSKAAFYSTSAPPDSAELLTRNPQLGGLAGQSDNWLGFLAVNQAMRGMLGLKPGNPEVPTRYITARTVKQDGTAEDSLYGDAYKAGFEKLWGIG